MMSHALAVIIDIAMKLARYLLLVVMLAAAVVLQPWHHIRVRWFHSTMMRMMNQDPPLALNHLVYAISKISRHSIVNARHQPVNHKATPAAKELDVRWSCATATEEDA